MKKAIAALLLVPLSSVLFAKDPYHTNKNFTGPADPLAMVGSVYSKLELAAKEYKEETTPPEVFVPAEAVVEEGKEFKFTIGKAYYYPLGSANISGQNGEVGTSKTYWLQNNHEMWVTKDGKKLYRLDSDYQYQDKLQFNLITVINEDSDEKMLKIEAELIDADGMQQDKIFITPSQKNGKVTLAIRTPTQVSFSEDKTMSGRTYNLALN